MLYVASLLALHGRFAGRAHPVDGPDITPRCWLNGSTRFDTGAADCGQAEESAWSQAMRVTLPGGNVCGDVNGDGTVDVADVNIAINVMLGKQENRQSTNYELRVDG